MLLCMMHCVLNSFYFAFILTLIHIYPDLHVCALVHVCRIVSLTFPNLCIKAVCDEQ